MSDGHAHNHDLSMIMNTDVLIFIIMIRMFKTVTCIIMSFLARKPVFKVSSQVLCKLVCTATRDQLMTLILKENKMLYCI